MHASLDLTTTFATIICEIYIDIVVDSEKPRILIQIVEWSDSWLPTTDP